MDILTATSPLILKTLWLSAHWAGLARKHALKRIVGRQDSQAEIIFLRDRVAELETALTLTRLHGRKPGVKPRYTAKERLLVIWYLEYFQVPRRHVNKHLGVARSTLYRWLRDIDRTTQQGRESANKTSGEIAALVWEIAKVNPHWGWIRIAMQLALLKVFLAASTVRNILQRPHPPGQSTNVTRTSAPREETLVRSIPAWYPNHVWSIDRTIFHRWGIWPIYLLVAIDHYSRRIVCVAPLEGANAGWTVEVLQRSFEESGAPKHITTDQEPPSFEVPPSPNSSENMESNTDWELSVSMVRPPRPNVPSRRSNTSGCYVSPSSKAISICRNCVHPLPSGTITGGHT